MIYAIIGIAFVVALFLIFRDDHDGSYNKSEKGSRRNTQAQPKQKSAYQKDASAGHKADAGQSAAFNAAGPKTEHKASGPSLKEQIEQAINEAKKSAEEPMKMAGKFIDVAKAAVSSAVEEARKQGWNFTGPASAPAEETVDEQFEEEELDLSFLDELDYYEDLEENTETFDITGLRYHCTVHDCGPIVGVVKPEPSNVHDARAQAVVRSDGKLLGYIPRTQLDWYEDFNEQNVTCPFVGEIELDRSSARLVAEIKVIIPSSREFVEEEILQ